MNTRLGGSQVLDLSTIVPGGTPSTILADLGADLITVENPTGSEDNSRSGPHRRPRVAVNRAKRPWPWTLPCLPAVMWCCGWRRGVTCCSQIFLGAKAVALGFAEPMVRARWADNRQSYLACALGNRSQPVVNSVW